jgi:hypothetical protein
VCNLWSSKCFTNRSAVLWFYICSEFLPLVFETLIANLLYQ